MIYLCKDGLTLPCGVAMLLAHVTNGCIMTTQKITTEECRRLHAAAAELAAWKGAGAQSQAGMSMIEMPLEDATVLVEYEYEPADLGQPNPERLAICPPVPGQVVVHYVLLNGHWVGSDALSPSIVEGWQDEILRGLEA